MKKIIIVLSILFSPALFCDEPDAQAPVMPDKPIWQCAKENDASCIRKYLAIESSDLNDADSEGGTALFYASSRGFVGIVILLVDSKKGVDVDQPNNNGTTPLMISAGHGHFNIVKVLVNKNANLTAYDKNKMDAEDWARSGKHEGIAEYLAKRIKEAK